MIFVPNLINDSCKQIEKLRDKL